MCGSTGLQVFKDKMGLGTSSSSTSALSSGGFAGGEGFAGVSKSTLYRRRRAAKLPDMPVLGETGSAEHGPTGITTG